MLIAHSACMMGEKCDLDMTGGHFYYFSAAGGISNTEVGLAIALSRLKAPDLRHARIKNVLAIVGNCDLYTCALVPYLLLAEIQNGMVSGKSSSAREWASAISALGVARNCRNNVEPKDTGI